MEENSIDYGVAIKNLLNEAFSFKIYRKYSIGAQIFIHFFTWPCLIAMVLALVPFYISYFFLTLLRCPVDYLDNYLSKSSKDKKHATEFIIYFIGYGTTFFLQTFIALLTVVLFINFFIIHVFAELWSIGGVEWLPFLNHQKERKDPFILIDRRSTQIQDIIILIVMIILGIAVELGLDLGITHGHGGLFTGAFFGFLGIAWIVLGFNKHGQRFNIHKDLLAETRKVNRPEKFIDTDND